MADEHMYASKDEVVGGDYAGTHWLATFYVYALIVREQALQSIGLHSIGDSQWNIFNFSFVSLLYKQRLPKLNTKIKEIWLKQVV